MRGLIVAVGLMTLAYGLLIGSMAVLQWWSVGTTHEALAQALELAPAAVGWPADVTPEQHAVFVRRHADYIGSFWFRCELLMTAVTGVLFAMAGVGLIRLRETGRRLLLWGIYGALVLMLYNIVVTLEWFRGAATGITIQIGLVNTVFIVLAYWFCHMHRVRARLVSEVVI